MSAIEHLIQMREAYVDYFRSALQEHRAKGAICTPEVWVNLNCDPGEDTPMDQLCIDIVADSDEGAANVCITSGPPEPSGVIETLSIGSTAVKIYKSTWDTLSVWVRHSDPDWHALEPWKEKWIDPARGPEDGDELQGVAHYLSAAVSEGGGFLFETDLGSAPVEALIELLETLVDCGATEIELGRSDGSDMPAEVLAMLAGAELTMQQVASAVASLLSTLPEVQRVESEDGRLVVHPRSGGAHHVSLDNLLRLLRRTAPEGRAVELSRYIRGQREGIAPETPPDLDQLRLLVKDERFLERVRSLGPKMKPLMHQRLAADLSLVCVWDMPNGMRFVDQAQAGDYELTPQQMFERATQNYLKHRRQVETHRHESVLVCRTNDCYDATLLADDDWCEEMSATLSGELLACAPSRNALLIGDSDDPLVVPLMQRISRELETAGDHLISPTILVRRRGRWEKFG